ncbi:hypothetical protein B4135_1366 [Caldibacillus debilis]|uniref:Uncharacterized protein n=1 Tax=Caldibacillus debilis TaxID=301148 RepID=A0A150MCP5_9BACI|nr:hypothetical protein B4135_1366 [Caldibacillus debilis]
MIVVFVPRQKSSGIRWWTRHLIRQEQIRCPFSGASFPPESC